MAGQVGANAVAAAFYAGKRLTRGNHKTDGTTYFLFDNPIARRLNMTETEQVAVALLQGRAPRMCEYSMCGWNSVTTRAALGALGIRASRRDNCAFFNGKEVSPSEWYTLAEIAELPYPPEKKRREPKFIQMTEPLFA